MSKFKASADDKFGVAEIMGFVFERVENIVGKGENAGYQHFLLFIRSIRFANTLSPLFKEHDLFTFELDF